MKIKSDSLAQITLGSLIPTRPLSGMALPSATLIKARFVLLAAALMANVWFIASSFATPPGYIYWSTIATTGANTSTSTIKRARLDGTDVETVISNPMSGRFGGIAFDVDKGLLYSGDISTLFRANLDGTGRTVLVTNTSVTDVELDLVHGKVYWSDTTRDFINRANLDGSEAETIIRLNYVDLVEGLALDPVAGKLFLSYCTSPAASAIRVANLDGSGMTTFKQLAAAAGPFEIEFDTDSGTLYWNEYHGGQLPQQVRKTAANGMVPVSLAFSPTNGLNNGIHFDPVEGKVYYADNAKNLCRANPDGSNLEMLLFETNTVNYVEVVRPNPVLALNLYAGLTIKGQIGVTYQIQRATHLDSPNNWSVLTNLTLPSSPYLFIDTSSAGRGSGFYRAIPLAE